MPVERTQGEGPIPPIGVPNVESKQKRKVKSPKPPKPKR